MYIREGGVVRDQVLLIDTRVTTVGELGLGRMFLWSIYTKTGLKCNNSGTGQWVDGLLLHAAGYQCSKKGGWERTTALFLSYPNSQMVPALTDPIPAPALRLLLAQERRV